MVTLDEELEEVWRALTRAAAEPTHGFRKLCLATTDEGGKPQARMVILRTFTKERRQLTIDTDPRTPKWNELRKTSWAQVNFWDEESKVQLRCDCHAKLLEEGELWEAARRSLSENAASDDAARRVSGAVLEEVRSGGELGEEWNFGVIQLQIQKMDWLKLSREGHRRACFTWTENELEQNWIQP